MRVWLDFTSSPRVLVLRPVIADLRRLERADDVKLAKRGDARRSAERVRRDPAALTDRLLSPVIRP